MRRSDYTELKRRLLELYQEAEAELWMHAQHPQLGGRRPVDCLYQEVSQVIARLEGGAYL